jgi:uncharacterized ferritin-like protein (DUF455 family)
VLLCYGNELCITFNNLASKITTNNEAARLKITKLLKLSTNSKNSLQKKEKATDKIPSTYLLPRMNTVKKVMTTKFCICHVGFAGLTLKVDIYIFTLH